MTSYSTAPRDMSSCMDNVQLEVTEEEGNMWSGGNQRSWRPFPSCYRGRMARNQGRRRWNVGSEGKDNGKMVD